jgi:hypothetical protein
MGSIVGAENVARELDYVRSTARQLGLDLDATSNAYLRLSASARGTALAGDETRNIFTAVSRAPNCPRSSSACTVPLLIIWEMASNAPSASADDRPSVVAARLTAVKMLRVSSPASAVPRAEADSRR